MNLRKIQYFLSVAEWKSITTAAEKNYISQQALSKHISELEYELGCRLFDRSKNAAALTPEGQALLPAAKKIVQDSSDLMNLAHALSKTCTGELRIGYGGYWEYPYLVEAVSQFSKESPYTKFEFTREHHGKLIQHFRQGRYDMILTFEREGIKPYPNSAWFPIDSSPLYAVVSEQNWLASRESISPEDLEHEKLICISRTDDYVFNEIISNTLGSSGIRPTYYEAAPHTAFDGLLLVAANMGVSLYTKWMSQVNCPGIYYIPIAPPFPPLNFGITYRTDQQLSLIKMFCEMYYEVWNAHKSAFPSDIFKPTGNG